MCSIGCLVLHSVCWKNYLLVYCSISLRETCVFRGVHLIILKVVVVSWNFLKNLDWKRWSLNVFRIVALSLLVIYMSLWVSLIGRNCWTIGVIVGLYKCFSLISFMFLSAGVFDGCTRVILSHFFVYFDESVHGLLWMSILFLVQVILKLQLSNSSPGRIHILIYWGCIRHFIEGGDFINCK